MYWREPWSPILREEHRVFYNRKQDTGSLTIMEKTAQEGDSLRALFKKLYYTG
jgi:hypothetical protein